MPRAKSSSKAAGKGVKRKATATKSKATASKRAKVASRAVVEEADDGVINEPPTEVLDVLVFGSGDCCELGMGPLVNEAVRPRLNTYLDSQGDNTFHIVQLDCGGMHTVALTNDNQIVTWGCNDNGALGRDTYWEASLRDADSDSSDSSDVDLNPKESIPAAISADHFPAETRFAQVAAGDSCSFALTDTGLVYGWGTFTVSSSLTSVLKLD
jgi:regulator of chromosome condensation